MADNYWVAGKPDKKVEVSTGAGTASSTDVGGIVYKSFTVEGDDFLDGGGAFGSFTSDITIPVGATVLKSVVQSVTAFSGDTTAVVAIGDGTDVDRYMTGTPSVFATAASGVVIGEVSGLPYHDEAKSVVVRITGGSDFTAIANGRLTVGIYYII
jgi:hypothetical protein